MSIKQAKAKTMMNSDNKRQKMPKQMRKSKEMKDRRGARPQTAAISVSNKQMFPVKNTRSERFTNSEAISTILGSTVFAVATRVYLNPGLLASFPWLSSQAARWQQYRFHMLRFRYVTRTATTTVGSVILSPDYNAIETPPRSDQEASNTQDAVEDSAWQEISCTLDPKALFPFGPRKNIRSGGVAGDLSNYDAGRFFVCTNGFTAAGVIGKLYVDYDVEFFVPQSTTIAPPGPSTISQYTKGTTAQNLTSAAITDVLFDFQNYDPIGIGLQVAGKFNPPPGVYHVTGYLSVTSTTAGSIGVTLTVLKNDVNIAGQNPINSITITTASTSIPVVQAVIDSIVPISQGDYMSVSIIATGPVQLSISASSIVLNFQLC